MKNTPHKEKTLSLSAGKDYNHPLGRYEFTLFDGDKLVARETGFKSKATALSAGKRKAAELLG